MTITGDVSLTELCDAVASVVAQAVDDEWRVQRPQDMTEGVNDRPLMQVYPERGGTTASGTDRRASRAGLRQQEVIVNVDLYAKQRAHIGEDMAVLLPLIDAVIATLEAQDVKPYFGLKGEGVKAFSWLWDRVTFEYGDTVTRYVGARFVLTFTIF